MEGLARMDYSLSRRDCSGVLCQTCMLCFLLQRVSQGLNEDTQLEASSRGPNMSREAGA